MSIDDGVEDYKEAYQKEFLEKQGYKSMLRSLYTYMPDMCWLKDIEGRYIWGNSKLIHGLLCQKSFDDIKGKTDLEIAGLAKEVLDYEHNVGGTCTDSDLITVQKGRQMLFIEEFQVNGIYLVLAVKKDVIKDGNGDVIGTVGVARDITDMYEILRSDNTSALADARAFLDNHLIREVEHG